MIGALLHVVLLSKIVYNIEKTPHTFSERMVFVYAFFPVS